MWDVELLNESDGGARLRQCLRRNDHTTVILSDVIFHTDTHSKNKIKVIF